MKGGQTMEWLRGFTQQELKVLKGYFDEYPDEALSIVKLRGGGILIKGEEVEFNQNNFPDLKFDSMMPNITYGVEEILEDNGLI